MEKKVVWLPYDFDTAIGINNEGSLVFSYNLEDIDHLEGGADVFNGQQSVIWKNLRAAFSDDLAQMYKSLRSTGALSYEKVERMFEEHQAKWPEAIFNEDAWFKYVDPLVNEGSGAYLAMMQGSKAEQRKWWLYNRFRYIDSKYNAGDALSDLIQIRGYAKSNVTVTPYADIYPSVKYGSYLVQTRGTRNVATTLTCPLDNVNDTEIYIYSASQLASVGDLSGFKVGFADFSMGTKLQSIKIGDRSSGYNNANLKALTLGNNTLLKTLDVRNCSGLGTGDQKTVDISGCEIIEEVYFDGTSVAGVTLPNGGFLKVLHLPATITNLTVMNQKSITDLTVPSYASVSTLRLENVPTVDTMGILQSVPAGTRVRLIGFAWEADDAEEIDGILDLLDTMRGLDENGINVDTAQVAGTIHTASLMGDEIASFNARYPYIVINADHFESHLYYMTWDGSQLLKDVLCLDGVAQEGAPADPVRPDTDRYTITGFVGWSTTMDASAGEADYDQNIVGNKYVYAAYTRTTKTYLTYATWDGSQILKTVTCIDGVAQDTAPSTNPSRADSERFRYAFVGWNTEQDAISALPGYDQNVTADRTLYAAYSRTALTYLTYMTWDGGTTLKTVTCEAGVPDDLTPPASPARADTERFTYTFVGWSTTMDALEAEQGYLEDVIYDRVVYAAYSRLALTYLTYKSWDGETTYSTVKCVAGVPSANAPASPTRTADVQYSYAFEGWSTAMDAEVAEAGVQENVSEDRIVYAAFSRTLRTYTVYWRNEDNTLLETDAAVQYGTMPQYNGATPTKQGIASTGWTPEPAPVTGDITYTAKYVPIYRVRFYNGSTLLATINVEEGSDAVYTGEPPTQGQNEFTGWLPLPVNVQSNLDCYAQFEIVMVEPDLQYLTYTLDETNGTMTITGLKSTISSLQYITIPDTINGYHVILG